MWDWYPRPKPRRPANGIRAKTARGQFGKTWWAGRWIAALERLVDSGRLSRGRSYARSGQVLNLDFAPGEVTAKVQGSMPRPYKVQIKIEPLSIQEWIKVIKAMAAQAVFAAKLLAGEMPENIEEAFESAGVALFPMRRADLQTDCSCPDYANPCKHIAAVYYLLGEQFDEDPFLLFRLRGRDKDDVLAALRQARNATAPEPAPKAKGKPKAQTAPPPPKVEKFAPLAQSLENFWALGKSLEELKFAFTPPAVPAAPVKRLGPPPFWSGKKPLSTVMEKAYLDIAMGVKEQVWGEE